MQRGCVCRRNNLDIPACICRACGTSYHLTCLGFDQSFPSVSHVYYCLECQEAGKLPLWHAQCRLRSCKKSAIEEMKFKFCSKDHQYQFFNEKARAVQGLSIEQLASLVSQTEQLHDIRKAAFDQAMPETSEEEIPNDPKIEAMLTQLNEMEDHRNKISQGQNLLCGYNDTLHGGQGNVCTNKRSTCYRHAQWLIRLRLHYEHRMNMFKQERIRQIRDRREKSMALERIQLTSELFPLPS